MATSLPMLLVARVMQGAGGGGLQPMAQAIMADSFPANKRGLPLRFAVRSLRPGGGADSGRLDYR